MPSTSRLGSQYSRLGLSLSLGQAEAASVGMSASPATLLAGHSGLTLTLTGTGTSWTPGIPGTPTFGVVGLPLLCDVLMGGCGGNGTDASGPVKGGGGGGQYRRNQESRKCEEYRNTNTPEVEIVRPDISKVGQQHQRYGNAAKPVKFDNVLSLFHGFIFPHLRWILPPSAVTKSSNFLTDSSDFPSRKSDRFGCEMPERSAVLDWLMLIAFIRETICFRVTHIFAIYPIGYTELRVI